MRYLSQLEPDILVDYFLRFPPLDFKCWLVDETPVFSAEFNLLTTLEPAVYKSIVALPGYRWWGQWLKPYTAFVGATVSEYALMPHLGSPKDWVVNLKAKLAASYSFLIIKDIAQQSPLLDDVANAHAEQALKAAESAGFILVEGQALAWVPIDFATIDDYLQRLSKSARKDFRRKLKMREHLDVRILTTGDPFFDEPGCLENFYQLYTNVYQQSDIHFDKLSVEFFTALLRSPETGVVMVYYAQNVLIGFNVSFVVEGKLIDKYVGFLYPAAREYNLYFVSWFVNLEYALAQGLSHYVAGWTDPQVKKSLGAQFTFTTHAVYIRNPVLRYLLLPFKRFFERDSQVVAAPKTALDKSHEY